MPENLEEEPEKEFLEIDEDEGEQVESYYLQGIATCFRNTALCFRRTTHSVNTNFK